MIINCKEALFFCDNGSWGGNKGKVSNESVVSESITITETMMGIGSGDSDGGLDGFTGDLGEFFNDLCAFNMLFNVAFGDWGRNIDRDG